MLLLCRQAHAAPEPVQRGLRAGLHIIQPAAQCCNVCLHDRNGRLVRQLLLRLLLLAAAQLRL
jgi:hypothetical protein